MSNSRFPDDWFSYLKDYMTNESFKNLRTKISLERENYKIYPEQNDIFKAFTLTPFKNIKVVILGQDPYHGYGQAHGLAFSVKKGVRIPPSLQNIFLELKNDLRIDPPNNGDLTLWAERGVFLLNTVLTVRENSANSHKGIGWEIFTDKVIETISKELNNIVFILWGKPAMEKAKLINKEKHLILTAPHPSPLSAYRGFFESSPFSKTNDYLQKVGKTPINWKLF
jgi:uracil-DNA glycosylase